MTISEYLKKNGPSLSSVLIKEFSTDSISQNAIRQRLSRLKSPIKKLKGFFKDNQSFFYLEEQFLSEQYKVNLLKALRTDAKAHYAIVRALEYHYGFLNKEHLPQNSFSPVKNLTSHKNFKNVLEDLKFLGVILEDEEYFSLNDSYIDKKNNFQLYKGIELAKQTLLSQFYDYARSIGLVSYDSGKFHSEFSKLQFGFVAPSYICGIVKYINSSINPAFVVADVLVGNNVTIEDVDIFLKKIDIIKNTSKSNFLPYLIVQNINQDAFQALKEKGIIVGFVNKLFGSEYEDLLKSLISITANAGAILKNNPEAYIELITKLNKLVDGKTNNLKGDIFELAVGYYYSNISQSIDVGKKLNQNGQQKEIDVYSNSQERIVICECKAYKRKIKLEEVEKWITQKIPTIYDWIRGFEYDKEVIFEFWSTSGFSSDAENFLIKRKQSMRKYKIDFLDEKEILARAQKSKAHKITDIMREYFLKD